MSNHAKKAAAFLRDKDRAHWHDQSLWFVREKRDNAIKSVPDWEGLRDTAYKIKRHTLANLPRYLKEFEKNARARGVHIHYAYDANEHNSIVLKILKERNVSRVVKSKSMLTEECGLNHVIQKNGIEIIDTDLGERIVQLLGEPPSHIVLPAIHRKKEEIGKLFHKYLRTEKGASDPTYLARAARAHLRERFLTSEAGISGVNFAIAETGGITIVTNEGNADLGNSLPPLYIACMGIEKLLPHTRDLSVFTRLLARSATGQPISTYTSHLLGPQPGQEMHVVMVDNGRSDILKQEKFRKALFCIRCGACMNTCPVYRRSGGYSYDYVIPGPIGTVLAPHGGIKKYKSLPSACTHCGSCTDICPVKVDLHEQILEWKAEIDASGNLGFVKKSAMMIATIVLGNAVLLALGRKLARMIFRILPKSICNFITIWGRTRDLPDIPAKSFREAYSERLMNGRGNGK
jgi:L-lactate dehydrogenase complex protein LldF